MVINGYMIREAIHNAQLVREALNSKFNDSLFKFDDETKETPSDIVSKIITAERNIAALQATQEEFNIVVRVNIDDRLMTLAEAIKSIGGCERIEQLWKSSSYGVESSPRTRVRVGTTTAARIGVEGTIYDEAKSTLTPEHLLKNRQAAARLTNSFRSAVANGNATNVELRVDESLFDNNG